MVLTSGAEHDGALQSLAGRRREAGWSALIGGANDEVECERACVPPLEWGWLTTRGTTAEEEEAERGRLLPFALAGEEIGAAPLLAKLVPAAAEGEADRMRPAAYMTCVAGRIRTPASAPRRRATRAPSDHTPRAQALPWSRG